MILWKLHTSMSTFSLLEEWQYFDQFMFSDGWSDVDRPLVSSGGTKMNDKLKVFL